MIKIPLSEIEQSNLRAKGIVGNNEIVYRENNCIYAEDAISGSKRVVNTMQLVKEGKDLLFG